MFKEVKITQLLILPYILTRLSEKEQQFIREHRTDDIGALLLRPNPAGLDLKKLAAQLSARQKARFKLPTWYETDELVFPPAMSVEQASSEATARYKASLVQGGLLLDLTGGMGVDTWAFAQRLRTVIYVEQQPELAKLAADNLETLGLTNVRVQTGNGLVVVQTLSEPADWLYLDPHRRDGQGGKVVRLADCEPDLSKPDVLADLLTKASTILLKTSPLIDIDATIRQLSGPAQGVRAVHVVALQGEVKEVLFIIDGQPVDQAMIEVNAVNLLSDNTIRICFQRQEERTAEVTFGHPETYLYEPNAAVLKAGAFRLVASRFGLLKLAPHSHLYTSDALRADFPGRIFRVDQSVRADRKALQAVVPGLKANLTVRNFPQTVAELRKKLGLQEGGEQYLFATTLLNGDKRLIVCRKAN